MGLVQPAGLLNCACDSEAFVTDLVSMLICNVQLFRDLSNLQSSFLEGKLSVLPRLTPPVEEC